MTEVADIPCLLCHSRKARLYYQKHTRAKVPVPPRYWECQQCNLIFLDPHCRLDEASEKAHYLTHDNNVDDPRYQNFVSDVVSAVMEVVGKGAHGLDYGAGPGPVISHLLQKEGITTDLEDPFFHPADAPSLDHSNIYDFVVCCEVVEHFHNPHAEFAKLHRYLKPGSSLVIKTHLWTRDQDLFPNWYYRKDPTHVCFYRSQTIAKIANSFGFSAHRIHSDRLIVLTK